MLYSIWDKTVSKFYVYLIKTSVLTLFYHIHFCDKSGRNSLNSDTTVKLHLTRKSTGGPPIRAMAVDSLRLFPPLKVPADLLTYLTSPSFWIPHLATFEFKKKNN